LAGGNTDVRLARDAKLRRGCAALLFEWKPHRNTVDLRLSAFRHDIALQYVSLGESDPAATVNN
jgi:hypothetical protein